MRILVISQLPPFCVGGAEQQAARLIEQWRAQGHEVMCFGRDMRGSETRVGEFTVPIRRIRVIHFAGRLVRGLSYSLSLAGLLLRHRRWADVVYCRFLGEAALVASVLKACGLLKTPLVAVPANAGPGGDISFLRGLPGHRALVRMLDRQCDAFNLIAPQMESDLLSLGLSASRFHRIPNGIPVAPARERARSGAPVAVTVGRLAPMKQFDLLLDAFAQVRAKGVIASLRIVGEGPERATLEARIAQLGLQDCVSLTGLADQARVRAELEAAHLFVLASRNEGFSNAALEAMERALPVIVSRCGGVDTYVNADAGWVVPVGDLSSLSRALTQALTLPQEQLGKMGARCRALVEEKFDMRAVAARNLALFESLAKPHE